MIILLPHSTELLYDLALRRGLTGSGKNESSWAVIFIALGEVGEQWYETETFATFKIRVIETSHKQA